MLFKPELIDEIVAGRKTETRRLWKPGDVAVPHILKTGDGFPMEVKCYSIFNNGRLKLQVGRDYAVQPGRGKAGVKWNPVKAAWGPGVNFLGGEWFHPHYIPLRIKVLRMWREDVREISIQGVHAEGFKTEQAFANIWHELNGKRYDAVAIQFKVMQ